MVSVGASYINNHIEAVKHIFCDLNKRINLLIFLCLQKLLQHTSPVEVEVSQKISNLFSFFDLDRSPFNMPALATLTTSFLRKISQFFS